jgi:L-alanine-DL-glutamate epimerase-like enolase superfamily enzyme
VTATAKIKSIDAFQVAWHRDDPPGRRSAFVRVVTEDGAVGYGEASPMQGGEHSLGIIRRDLAPNLIGADAYDHAVLYDRMLHKNVKLGPEGALTGALAAIDIALWDIKGKIAGLPICKLLGGGWRTEVPFYASIGGNANRTVDEVVKTVEARWKTEMPAAIKIRWDGDRSKLDHDIPGDIAKAKAVRKLVGDTYPLAFDANNNYSVGGAIRVGRALEELGFIWFEEPVQHYDVRGMGEVAQRLDITVSAAEQTYTVQALVDIINAGVRMVQPDIVKMGGVTGLMQCAAICYAHGVELVPHQTQPTIGHAVNLHLMAIKMHSTKPMEWNDPEDRDSALMQTILKTPWRMHNGTFRVPSGPGLGIEIDPEQLGPRIRPVPPQL